MTPQTRADLHAAIEQRYPDNNTRDITPLRLREGMHELVDSAFLLASDQSLFDAKQPLLAGLVQLTANGTAITLDKSHLNRQVEVRLTADTTLTIPTFSGVDAPALLNLTVVRGSSDFFEPQLSIQSNAGSYQLYAGGFLQLAFSKPQPGQGAMAQLGVLGLYEGKRKERENLVAYPSGGTIYNADVSLAEKTYVLTQNKNLDFLGYDPYYSPLLPPGIKGKLLLANDLSIFFSARAGVTLVLPDSSEVAPQASKSVTFKKGTQLTCFKYSDARWIISATGTSAPVGATPTVSDPQQVNTNVLRFDKNYVHAPISSGTFTVDLTGQVVGKETVAYLTATASDPAAGLPAATFQLLSGAYKSGVDLLYTFRVGGNGKIHYIITDLP